MMRLLFFAVFFTFTSYAHSTNAIRKNVLFIIVDDLRPALGCYGDVHAVTPNIDRLAEKSALFRWTYAQQSLCAPSRNSMLTSRRPDVLHLYDFYSYWRKTVGNFTTIPQYFKQNGYETISIGKVFHPGASSNNNDDFPLSWSTETFHPSTEHYMNEAVCPDKRTHTFQQNLICPISVETQPEHTLPDIQSVDEAKRLLCHRYRHRPFLLAVGLHKPHIPFRFPRKYLRYHHIDKFRKNDFLHVPNKLPTVAFNPYNDIRQRDDVRRLNISFPFGPMLPRRFAWRIRQAYYASVTYVDNLIGDLLKCVDFSNTIVVLTSDHGYSLGEHAVWAKYTNYEVGVRVPLIIYSPQHQYQQTWAISELVELVDLFPTIVDLAALPKIKTCRKGYIKQITCTQGKSLVSYFTNVQRRQLTFNGSDSFAISQYPRPGVFPTQFPNSDRPRLRDIKIMGYSLRISNFRYTIWLEFNAKTFTQNWNRFYGEELYDHTTDPDEYINLYDRQEFAAIKLQLKNLLRTKLDN